MSVTSAAVRRSIILRRLNRAAGDVGRAPAVLCALVHEDATSPVLIYSSPEIAHIAARGLRWADGTYTVRPAHLASL